MGLPAGRVKSAVRFTFGKYNTVEDVEKTVEILKSAVKKIVGGQAVFYRTVNMRSVDSANNFFSKQVAQRRNFFVVLGHKIYGFFKSDRAADRRRGVCGAAPQPPYRKREGYAKIRL